MTSRVGILALVLPVCAFGCVEDNPDTCRSNAECTPPLVCDWASASCILPDDGGADGDVDGGTDGKSDVRTDAEPDGRDAGEDAGCSVDAGCASDGGHLVCNPATRACVECVTGTDCTGTNRACDTSVKRCVECVGDTTCTTGTKLVCDTSAQVCVQCLDNSKCSGATPICESKACRACKADVECTNGPKICMADGHCATDQETVYVQAQDRATACPDATADGSAAKPYCTLGEGTAALSANRSLLILRGPASDQLALSSSFPVTVLGQKNSAGKNPVIPSVTGTGISVASGIALARDLTVLGTAGFGGRGIAATGSSTNLTLLRVTVTGNDGIGVEVNNGATLTMDKCVIEGNVAGGFHNNQASSNVKNSLMASNGYGAYLENAVASIFESNTVVNNSGNSLICAGGAQTATGSIVVGAYVSCTLDHCVTTAPTFDSARPYHLTAHLACTGGDPTSYPIDDIDGEPRHRPIDCGADQYP